MCSVNSVRIPTDYCILLAVLLLPYAADAIIFTSKYQGQSVTALVGSSITFTWSFSGDVDRVTWGLKRDGSNDFTANGRLVLLSKIGSVSLSGPQAYNGRVSGSRSGNSSSGQAIFILRSITKDDERSFGCQIDPNDPLDNTVFDFLQLVVNELPRTSLSSVQASYDEGSSAYISCTASGKPDPDVKWVKNGIIKSSGKKTASLTFSRIKRTDAGQYTCKAKNSVGIDVKHTRLVVNYPPTIQAAITAIESGIGLTVTLKCVSDGVPTPTLTWYKPDGSQISSRTATDNTVNVKMNVDQDFGDYKCNANNGHSPADNKIVNIKKINKPGSPTITSSAADIQATSLTVRWNAPADNGGSPITAYRVVILKGGSKIKNVVITYPKSLSVAGLVRDTEYIVKVFAINSVFEGPAVEKSVKTNYEGIPITAEIYGLPSEVTSDTITLKWREPQNNGRVITQYNVYQRIVTDGKPVAWNRLKTITDISVRELKLKLEKGKAYEFVVTATNALGESLIEDGKIKRVKVSGIPAAVEMNEIPDEVTDSAITIKWSEPQNHGRVITQYTVYQRIVTDGKPGEWNRLKTITDISVREMKVKLEKGKVYEFVVTATNALGESLIEDGKIKRVNASGIPVAVEMSNMLCEVTDSAIILKWSEPKNYGREITQYTVYQRIVTDGKLGEWGELKNITDVSVRELKVELQKDKEYEFVVTATNVHGESLIEEGKIKRFKAIEAIGGSSCDKEKIILHVVYVNVIIFLLMINLILCVVIWIMHSRSVISKTNRRNIRTGCRNEFIVLNPMPMETENQPSASMVPSGAAATYAVPGTQAEGDMPPHPSTPSWEIIRDQVEIIKVIGKGAFSQVAKATAWNISGNEEYITVAVKMLKANAPESDRRDLMAEVELMKKMKPHPHVIKLMGCVTETDPPLVLIEYVPFGDLLGYLRKSRGLNDTYFKDPDVKPQTNLTAEQLMEFAWQVADGMFYLSSRKIIHRDLAARNVLVGEGEKCKVTDFGMARNVHQDDIYTRQSRGRLPVKWTAYEALLYGTYTTQSDVWSYGILLYEILTVGGSPYPGIQARQIARKLQEGFRMPKPKHVDNQLYQIMLNCWEENPSDRRTFAKLKDTMKEMGRNHKMCVNLEQYDNSLYGKVEDLTDE